MTGLEVLVRFLQLGALLLLVGCFSFDLLVRRPAFKAAGAHFSSDLHSALETQFRIARWSLLVAVCAAMVGLIVKVANVTGLSWPEAANLHAASNMLLGTQFGMVWMARMAIACFLAIALFAERSGRVRTDSIPLRVTSSVLSSALLMTLGATGHAAAAEGATLLSRLALDALHLLAAGAWLGGLAPLAILFGWTKRGDHPQTLLVLQEATARFSRLGFASVAVLVITGLFNTWYLVGGMAPLLGTAYGYLLLVKLALLVPLLGFASRNSFYLKPRLHALTVRDGKDRLPDLIVRLKRSVIAEFSLGAAILLVVAGMGITPPARHVQPGWPFSFRLDWSSNIPRTADARSQINNGGAVTLAGVALLGFAVARRRHRRWLAGLGGILSVCGSWMVAHGISIDAYPTTYKRPFIVYQAISVANGLLIYGDNCAVCHGISGYGDGPAAQGQNPRADLTAPHTALHTAGDLYWWLSYGITKTAMPGFKDSLTEEERWDLINFLRALSGSEKARSLAAVVETEAWLVAPDFVYGTNRGETKTLKDHRGEKAVLLVLFSLPESMNRLRQLDADHARLAAAGLEILLVRSPKRFERSAENAVANLSLLTEGSEEVFKTYSLFSHSFEYDRNSPAAAVPPHTEILIDKRGYIRARWMAGEGTGWLKLENLLRQLEALSKETSQAPAPDDHVH